MLNSLTHSDTIKSKLAYVGDGIVTANSTVLRIIDIAKTVADSEVPVLILGESGTGKEVLANFIHRQSNRSQGPFIKVNCAAVPYELLESELFGYNRGAFTGALRDKPGKFELADGGTLFLDEIAEMNPYLQAKLLHVLQDGEFDRLGARAPVRVDVRIIAATNRKLCEALRMGQLRTDLLFRLNVIQIEIPPLRERPEDIPLLSNYFFKRYRDRYATASSSTCKTLPKEISEAFNSYDWPGNVRQLENTVKRYLILSDTELHMDTLGDPRSSGPAAPLSLKELGGRAAEQAEKAAAFQVLTETGWNRKESARRLRISYRAFRRRLKRWNFQQKDSVDKGMPQGVPMQPYHDHASE